MNLPLRTIALLGLLLLLLSPARAGAQSKPPMPGEIFPDVPLAAPTVGSTLSYLGLPPDAKQMRLSQIKAKVVVIEVFNMY